MLNHIRPHSIKPMGRKAFVKRIVAIELIGTFGVFYYYANIDQFRRLIISLVKVGAGNMFGIIVIGLTIAINLLEFDYVLRRAKDIGMPWWVATIIVALWRYSSFIKIFALLALAAIPPKSQQQNGANNTNAVAPYCPNFKPIVPADSIPNSINLQSGESPVSYENEEPQMIRQLKRRTIIFISFNVIGVVIILYGLFTKYTPAIISGIVVSAIGINFSILALPCLIALGISIIIAGFVTPHIFPVAISVALIATWTAYCLYVEYKQLKDGTLPF